MVLSTILHYKKKFKNYGEIVFCADDKNYWRKSIFAYYKANRKKARDASGYDWKLIFDSLNKIRDEIRDNFPYKVLQIEGAEADDIIATLSKHSNERVGFLEEPEKVLILSSDKDFLQLQKYKNIEQFSPMQKKYLKTDSPSKYLMEHIIRGDSGDGIPNFLSPDDVFVLGKQKQKSIMQKKLDEWLKFDDPTHFCDDDMLRNYKRNENLIDLTKIPQDIQDKIVDAYVSNSGGNRKNMFNYFVKNKLKYLMEGISEF